MKSFINAFKGSGFSGRVSSKDFWNFTLINLLLLVIIFYVPIILEVNLNISLPSLYVLYSIIVFFPSLSMQVRRLHDIGKSGSWLLLYFIPVIGTIIIIVLFAKNGDTEENLYGPAPSDIETPGNSSETASDISVNAREVQHNTNINYDDCNNIQGQNSSYNIEPSITQNITTEDKPVKHKSKRLVYCILSVFLIISVGINIYQGTIYNNIVKENKQLQSSVKYYEERLEYKTKTISKLKDDIDSMQRELLFYEWSAVIATDEDGRYHTYECPNWQDADGFYIFNYENAIYQGFNPCPYCNPSH